MQRQGSLFMDNHDLFLLQEKTLSEGFDNLSLEELFTLLLSDSQYRQEIAALLINRYVNLHTLLEASVDSLIQLDGIGLSYALRIKAAVALAHHLSAIRVTEKPLIERPSDAIKLFEHHLTTLTQECLQVLLLNIHNRVMDIQTIYIGSINATIVRVAEILRPAVINNSTGIIVAHNHPSGNATPSQEDIKLTQDLVQAGKTLDIAIVDHLIIGDGEWVSMREKGLGF